MTGQHKTLAMILSLVLLTGAAVAQARSGDEERTRLRARLIAMADAGDVSGKADWEFRGDRNRRKFSIEIEGFTPGETFAVLVNGEETGAMIAVDGFGIGELDLDDNAAEEEGDLPFPADFPSLVAGDVVVVGPLQGTLLAK